MESIVSEVSIFNDAIKPIEFPKNHKESIALIKDCYRFKPEGLIMKEEKWKYMIRNVYRGKSILLVGPSGFGKTMAVKMVQNVFSRPKFFINLGATQDPRTSLIGTTHFNKEVGTFFRKSYFIEAITTPDAVILLDELSRAHPDAWNILMAILDPNQRYVRIDEDELHPTVPVADGVSFLATANIGNEYTATRTMDKALLERFQIVEVDILTQEEELKLLKYMFPSIKEKLLSAISKIAGESREEINTEGARISTMVSPRMSVEMASLLYDGFSMREAAAVAIYPHFSAEGGNNSERVFMSQLVQKHIPTEQQTGNPKDKTDGGLFTQEEVDNAFVH